MNTLFWNVMVAGWLGLLCAFSPCPLASNVAAAGFLAQHAGRKHRLLAECMLYATGRILTYVLLSWILAAGMAAVPGLSHTLQKYMNLLMGPLLLLVSVVLLDLIDLPLPNWTFKTGKLQFFIRNSGAIGSLLLGMFFALSFCPTSAALYFGNLLPLMLNSSISLSLAAIFGLATAVPVIAVSMVIAFFSERIGAAFRCLDKVQSWIRKGTALLFLGLGLWMTLHLTMKLL